MLFTTLDTVVIRTISLMAGTLKSTAWMNPNVLTLVARVKIADYHPRHDDEY